MNILTAVNEKWETIRVNIAILYALQGIAE